MLMLGIHEDTGFVYEGRSNNGRVVWPSPVITPAKIQFPSEGPLKAETSNASPVDVIRFREDFYDPIARIRRGRFYEAQGSQPQQWFLEPHPATPSDHRETKGGKIAERLNTYFGNPIWPKFFKDNNERPFVILGKEERYTIWKIVDVEAIATGEDLVTLKAQSSLGILPTLHTHRLPESMRTKIEESIDGLLNEVNRSSPVSVVDRSRDAASHILIGHFDETKELSALASRLEEEKRYIAANAARIIARFHSRAKPVEKEKRAMRPIREEDAQLATQCVGVVLCELGWGDWE